MYALRIYLFLLVSMATVKNICTSEEASIKSIEQGVKKPPEHVCKTKACIGASKRFRYNMDKEVNPCDNFYQFACGGFVKKEKIPKIQLSTSTLSKIGNALTKQLRPLLEEGPFNLRAFKMMKHLYDTCMDTDSIDARGHDILLKLVKEAGGWPVLEGNNWNENTSDWVATTFNLQNKQIDGDLIDVSIVTNPKDSFKRMILVGQLNLKLNRIYYIKGREHKKVKAYAKYMRDIAVLLGAKRSSAAKEMEDVLDFEIKLAKITLRPEDQRDPSTYYHTMKLQELQSKYPIVNWKYYLKRYMENVITFKSTDNITIAAPSFLENLQKLLHVTNKRTIANYQFWVGVSSKVRMLTKAFRDRWFKYYKETSGAKKQTPRWKACLTTTKSKFSLAFGSMYIRKLFPKKSKAIASDLVERLRQEMLSKLKRLPWMDEETRAKAILKALATTMHVAYPDEFLDDNKIEEYYEKLDIMEDPFFESMIKFDVFVWKKLLNSYYMRINKTDWRDHGDVVAVNAFYSSKDNSVQIPAGILQDIIFSPNRPKYMNYATIGFAIGHEITHGFDDQGKHYDELGNLVDWWEPKTKKEFDERVQCVIDQAYNFTDKQVNLSLNGITTQGENVADLGGAKLAVAAYKSWAQTLTAPEPKLVGLEEYTQHQLFWISTANFWCKKTNDDELRNQILTNEHPPAEYRVVNALMNHDTFAEDFNCPEGSPMNPVKKCIVW